ncbi:hypothetical protein [Siccirubricoccus phaeus]|nr:hypothetical protein [Siccirubricoccus phaeus]
MKAVLTGIVLAALLAVAAAFVLDTEIQQTAEQHYRTEAVRL